MLKNWFNHLHSKIVVLATGLGFLSAGAWVSFGIGAGLAAVGLSLVIAEEVS